MRQKKSSKHSRIAREVNHYEPYYRRVLYFVFGAFLAMLTLVLGFSLLLQAVTASQNLPVFVNMFTCLLAYCAVWLIATSIRRQLTLTPNSLTLRSAFTTRTVARNDIAYTSHTRIQGLNILFLHSSQSKRAFMRLPFVFEDGDAVRAWMPPDYS